MKKLLLIIPIVALIIVAVLVLKPNSPSTTTQNKTAAPAKASNAVSIKDFAFSPRQLTVKKGTTVTWTNTDSAAHTVTETDGQDGPDSKSLASGASYSFTFATAGTFKYLCSIHPSMTATVVVTE